MQMTQAIAEPQTARAQSTARKLAVPFVAKFDYGMVAPEVATNLRNQAVRIRATMKATTSAIIALGRDLLAVKQHLNHGQICIWVEAECGFSVRSAQRYMRVANFAYGKNDTVSLLPLTVVEKLTARSVPTAVATAVISHVESGEIVSDDIIKSMLVEHGFERRQAKKREEQNRRRSKNERNRRDAAERARQEQRCQEERASRLVAVDFLNRFGPDCARFVLGIAEWQWGDIRRHLRDLLAEAGR
jgi:hypothetical protein